MSKILRVQNFLERITQCTVAVKVQFLKNKTDNNSY